MDLQTFHKEASIMEFDRDDWFSNCWIGRGRPWSWFDQSPDLTPYRFLCLKSNKGIGLYRKNIYKRTNNGKKWVEPLKQ